MLSMAVRVKGKLKRNMAGEIISIIIIIVSIY